MSHIDPNFDWVSARAKCSPETAFDTLRKQIEADVEKRNALLGATELQYAIKFKTAVGAGAIRVARYRMDEMLEHVTLSQTNDGVSAVYSSSMNLSSIETTLTLANDQECKLRTKEARRELYFWQFRRLALEPILFGSAEWWK